MRRIMHSINFDNQVVKYTPARLVESSEWYVTCSAIHPATGKLKAKKFKVNRIQGIKARRQYGRQLAEELNSKLRSGWNPWIETVASKGVTTIVDAIAHFLKRKGVELRPDSIRSYKSNARNILHWLKLTGNDRLVVTAFNGYMARDYMEYIMDQEVGPVRYNNLITFGRLLFAWMIDREYCKENPFKAIKKIPEEDKIRKPIPLFWREKLFSYLQEHDPAFLLPCMLLFYGQIRPSEQIRLRVRDVTLEQRLITISSKASKAHIGRCSTIPDGLLPYLEKLPWPSLSGDDYLITKNWKPGGVRLKRMKPITDRWTRLRKEIGMPKPYQFYSLRDTGIVYMLEQGVPINHVMAQAGHRNLETTSKYLRYVEQTANPQIKMLDQAFAL